MLVQRDDNPKSIYHHCHLAFVHCYIYRVCIMCNTIYIVHSELIKICCSFPHRIFEMQFFSETFKMDFRLSTSLKGFALSGFYPPLSSTMQKTCRRTQHYTPCCLLLHGPCPWGQIPIPKPKQRVESLRSSVLTARLPQT